MSATHREPEHASDPAAEPAAAFTLASRTPAAWASAVARDVPALLSDHAHCELKAAASAMTLLRNHGQRADICQALGPLLREEAEHAQRVLRELASRGHGLQPDRPNPYTDGLISAAGRPRRREDGLLDSLLVAALIEMRSHERFERLAECDELAELRTLYASLGEAEARHGELFLDLAGEAAEPARVEARFTELAEAEASVIGRLPFGHRVHSGLPPA
jgi:tRNA-(ms[2]io[6]A)-hydroxylase